METINIKQRTLIRNHIPDTDEYRWYALYTKSRHEKFVEEQLNNKGIQAYTPKRKIGRIWSDRIKMIEQPVFRSYCFAKFSIESKTSVLSQPGIVNIVRFGNQYVPISDSVINSLKIVLENQLKIDPYPYINVGDRVQIRRGPLRGSEGYVIEKRKHNTKMVISVDAIASSIVCIVDSGFVDSI